MNIEASTIISFLTGLGAGSIILTLLQHKLSQGAKNENRLFDERKKAFDGLLVAYAALAENWTDSKAKQFALCEARVQLVSSENTVNALNTLVSSESGSHQRELSHKKFRG